jgi:N6-L-threonylcarbamoyladenine synthase
MSIGAFAFALLGRFGLGVAVWRTALWGATRPLTMTQDSLTLLGIETSCDETAAAIVRRAPDGQIKVLADVTRMEAEDHLAFGGIVPEIAARAHVERLDGAILKALTEAGIGLDDLDGIAATAGPGLIGGVMVGLVTAKAIALARNLPLIPVNHLEGHALSPRLSGSCPFPYLLLLVSGGHCQFLLVEGLDRMTRLGSTIDDAAGEAFDKTANRLGLGFPGGPAVERHAALGDARRFSLPRPLLDQGETLDMSFAGLKSALARQADLIAPLTQTDINDLCASFQAAVSDILSTRARQAMAKTVAQIGPGHHRFVVAGGVAANAALRRALAAAAENAGFSFHAPPLKWCTDNAAMIALAGAERMAAGLIPDRREGLNFAARPRWPLDGEAARHQPVLGLGKKGAKA